MTAIVQGQSHEIIERRQLTFEAAGMFQGAVKTDHETARLLEARHESGLGTEHVLQMFRDVKETILNSDSFNAASKADHLVPEFKEKVAAYDAANIVKAAAARGISWKKLLKERDKILEKRSFGDPWSASYVIAGSVVWDVSRREVLKIFDKAKSFTSNEGEAAYAAYVLCSLRDKESRKDVERFFNLIERFKKEKGEMPFNALSSLALAEMTGGISHEQIVYRFNKFKEKTGDDFSAADLVQGNLRLSQDYGTGQNWIGRTERLYDKVNEAVGGLSPYVKSVLVLSFMGDFYQWELEQRRQRSISDGDINFNSASFEEPLRPEANWPNNWI